MTRITLIAAVAENGVIGNQGEIPWRVPGEMAHFKATTLGHTLIMGRKTFESIGRVLPGRRTIVLTRDPEWHHLEVATARTLHDALQLAGAVDEVFIAGGAEVYAQALPLADRMILSEIPAAQRGTRTSRRGLLSGGAKQSAFITRGSLKCASWRRIFWTERFNAQISPFRGYLQISRLHPLGGIHGGEQCVSGNFCAAKVAWHP